MVVLADEDTSTSWAQTIQRYDASRKTLEWAPNEFKPVTKIGNGERKAMERELDPVVMQFRDPDREAARTQRKTEEMNGTLSRYSGIVAGRRNIINGYGGPPKTPPVQRMEQIREQVDGDVAIPLPELSATEAPAVANYTYRGLQSMSQRLASVQPRTQFAPLSVTKVAAERAETRMRVADYWDAKDFSPLLDAQVARYMFGYGTSPEMIAHLKECEKRVEGVLLRGESVPSPPV